MTASTGEQQRSAIPADTFAVRLMLVRVHAGYLTIEEASRRAGLNYGSWSNWERGIKPRDMDDVAAAISEAFEIDKVWLMWGGQLAKPQNRLRASERPNQRSVNMAERPMPPIPRCAPDVRSPSIGGVHRRPKVRGLAAQPIAA